MNEKHNLFSATGIPSLFLIFAVLMLVILSLLGYGTSRQDLKASTLSLKQATDYYNACNDATDFCSELSQTLERFRRQAANKNEYYQLVADYAETAAKTQWTSKDHILQYSTAFSQTQSLSVSIAILWPDKTAEDSTCSFAKILTWNTTVTADWNPDTKQSVYKGE